jgi:hypothetical protein
MKKQKFCSFSLYGRFETGRFKNRTFWKLDILKPDVLKPDVKKPDNLWVYTSIGTYICLTGYKVARGERERG